MEMENIRIESQERKGYNGRKYIEFFNVIADTERFGENEIMFQGTFNDCVEYLKREGYNYQISSFLAYFERKQWYIETWKRKNLVKNKNGY